MQFLVQCMSTSSILTPLPPFTSNSTGLRLALGLPRPIDIFRGKKKIKNMTFHPLQSMVYFRFSRKKRIIKRQWKSFLINEVDQIFRVRPSVFGFSIGDKHAKIIRVGPARGDKSKHAGGACIAVGPCEQRWANHMFRYQGMLPQNCFSFLFSFWWKWNWFTIFLLVLFKSQDQFIFSFLFFCNSEMPLVSGRYMNLTVAVCLNEIEMRHSSFFIWR